MCFLKEEVHSTNLVMTCSFLQAGKYGTYILFVKNRSHKRGETACSFPFCVKATIYNIRMK